MSLSSYLDRLKNPKSEALGPCSGLWRSEPMSLVSITMPREAIKPSLLSLSRDTNIQFIDLNKNLQAFQRPFSDKIRRCDEAERKLRYLRLLLERYPFRVRSDDAHEPLQIKTRETLGNGNDIELREPVEVTLEKLEDKLDEVMTHLQTNLQNYDRIQDETNVKREYLAILRNDGVLFPGESKDTIPNHILGAIDSDKWERYIRFVKRACKSNVLYRSKAIGDGDCSPIVDKHGKVIAKHIFVLFSSSELGHAKALKLCDSMGVRLFRYDRTKVVHEVNRTQSEIIDAEKLYARTCEALNNELKTVADNFQDWVDAVTVEKAIYSVMNYLRWPNQMRTIISSPASASHGPAAAAPVAVGATHHTGGDKPNLHAVEKAIGAFAVIQAWVPKREVPAVDQALREAAAIAQVAAPTAEVIPAKKSVHGVPPTFFLTNHITESFQSITDAYGMARYREINPGVMAIVTFPYLFGVMYGDIGHGIMLTAFAALLILAEKQLMQVKNEIFQLMFGGRYLLFLMGLFATYLGLLYNDMFGFSVNLFGTGYTWEDLDKVNPNETMYPISPAFKANGSVFPSSSVVFGLDPAWEDTDNKLTYVNSIKMKCAVIIGVVQMTLGLIFSLLNHLHFKDMLHVWFGFIPELVFLMFTFGYMDLLIIIKWCTPWTNTHNAASLLETMTNFFLKPGSLTPCGTYPDNNVEGMKPGDPIMCSFYSGQAGFQKFLLFVAFLCVPLMLCPIPILEIREHKAKQAAKAARSHREPEASRLVGDRHDEDEDEEEHFDESEIWIHQVIHTIEFVLGAVSNTASYLRLWALSLAHSELSEVFLNFLIFLPLKVDSGSGVAMYIGFACWIGATIGVLLTMESLSAFLHALRLHWVEFNGKFYAGDGVRFAPFSITAIQKEAHESFEQHASSTKDE